MTETVERTVGMTDLQYKGMIKSIISMIRASKSLDQAEKKVLNLLPSADRAEVEKLIREEELDERSNT
ncbi:MAG: hypothetical protein LBC65_04615 [Oscillospiraceae bacterium]|jgi:hypothetical protein|nr:hypothetical protein [Oscillospiraceae bacterium]